MFLKNVIVFITLLSCIYSIPITESIAREIALNLGKERSEILSLSIDSIDSYLLNVNKIFYIVHYKPKGFALIAADKLYAASSPPSPISTSVGLLKDFPYRLSPAVSTK